MSALYLEGSQQLPFSHASAVLELSGQKGRVCSVLCPKAAGKQKKISGSYFWTELKTQLFLFNRAVDLIIYILAQTESDSSNAGVTRNAGLAPPCQQKQACSQGSLLGRAGPAGRGPRREQVCSMWVSCPWWRMQHAAWHDVYTAYCRQWSVHLKYTKQHTCRLVNKIKSLGLSLFTPYQNLPKPGQVSVCVCVWGSMNCIHIFWQSSRAHTFPLLLLMLVQIVDEDDLKCDATLYNCRVCC